MRRCRDPSPRTIRLAPRGGAASRHKRAGDIRVAATRRRSDGAISGMRVDALAPTEDASIYLVLARLPVSTIISVRLTVGNDAAAPRTGVTVGVTPPTMRSRRGESRVPRDARAVRVAPDSHGLPPQ